MVIPKNQKVWAAVDTLFALASVAIIGVLCGTYFWVADTIPREGTPDPASWRLFVMAILTNVIVFFLLFSLGFITLRTLNRIRAGEEQDIFVGKMQEAVTAAIAAGLTPTNEPIRAEGYTRFRDEPSWGRLFAGSSSIRIVVHYFDTWLNENEAALLSFFDRGGKLQIVIPDPTNGVLVGAIQTRFQGTQKAVLEAKIRNTYEKVVQIRKRSRRSDAVLEGYKVSFQPLYCAVQFDGSALLLSPFEHLREVAVGSPAFIFHLAYFPEIRQWFDKEFAFLLSQGVKIKET